MKGIDLSSSFSSMTMFVYTNAIGLCVLILYPPTLSNSLISTRNLPECQRSPRVLLCSFRHRIMSSANREELASIFKIRIPFIYFSCLIVANIGFVILYLDSVEAYSISRQLCSIYFSDSGKNNTI